MAVCNQNGDDCSIKPTELSPKPTVYLIFIFIYFFNVAALLCCCNPFIPVW